MRMLVIKEDSDLEDLGKLLLSARLSEGSAGDALARLQEINPHVDLKKLRAGTVLLVPNAPGFKISATDSVPGQALEAFTELVKTGLGGALERMKSGNAARAAERAEVQAVLRLAGVKRVIEADPELKQLVALSNQTFKDDEVHSEEAQEQLSNAAKAALTKLKELERLLG